MQFELKKHADIIYKAIKGEFEENNLEILKQYYFDKNFPATMPIRNDMNALMVAASEGTPETIKLILEKILPYINQTDLNGRTALHFACAAGLAANVKALLQNPTIKRDERTIGGNTAIMNAV